MPSLYTLLEKAVSMRATDIHICADAPLFFRMGGSLVPISPPLSEQEARSLSLESMTEVERRELETRLDLDLVVANAHGRFRVNVGYFQGKLGAIIRILPKHPRTLADLKLPEIVQQLSRKSKGIVLVTGSTSQGKTTTLAAMVDDINTHLQRHIITIEDPIEYVHTNKRSIVRQREAGKDTRSFQEGLRAALRQDPNVIMIGEMRDYETIKIALTAAETGVLVLSTLHIISVDKILERLLSYASLADEGNVRYRLADSLLGVIHQELLPATGGGKRIACEILLANDAVRHILRKRGAYQLKDVVTTGRQQGMIPMKQSIETLLQERAITTDVAHSVLAQYAT
jgi:twitching motility protein PilT